MNGLFICSVAFNLYYGIQVPRCVCYQTCTVSFLSLFLYIYKQYNLNGSNTDGSFTIAFLCWLVGCFGLNGLLRQYFSL